MLVALLFVQADDSLAGYLIAIGGLALIGFVVYFVQRSIRQTNRKKRKKASGSMRTTNETRFHQNSQDDGVIDTASAMYVMNRATNDDLDMDHDLDDNGYSDDYSPNDSSASDSSSYDSGSSDSSSSDSGSSCSSSD